jgi:arsenical pump membrane protein
VDEAVAYSTLALTVTLAVSRPRLGLRGLRVTPGLAALFGVLLLLLSGLLAVSDMLVSARLQWRPIVTLVSVMVMTGVVQEVSAFERIAQRIEAYARRTSPERAFTAMFLASLVTPSLLNNDAAILLLTPLSVALSRRLYPDQPKVTEAFAFAVFLAPGVAPFVISNPMNMIVAQFAGVGFNAYALVMLPISLVGAALTYLVLRVVYARTLREAKTTNVTTRVSPPHRAERPAVALLLAVFFAYPVMASLGGPIWVVSVVGAACAFVLARLYDVAPTKKLVSHVSPDILVFLWGVFLVVVGLRHVGVIDRLTAFYDGAPVGSGREIAQVGVVSAVGSALVDNHPMALLNMLALEKRSGSSALLAALVGGDIGPRLLPIGSLAGLLWMHLLRRADVHVSVGRFVKLGTLVLIPTLTASLLMLWLLR